MEKEQVHVCSVFTKEFPSEMKEQIKRSLFEAGYKLHNFQSVGEFRNWYSDYQAEVCLLLDEEIDSIEYDSLKGEFAELNDFIFVDSHNAGKGDWTGTPVLIDKKSNELDEVTLIEEIKAIIPIDENEAFYDDENEVDSEMYSVLQMKNWKQLRKARVSTKLYEELTPRNKFIRHTCKNFLK